jgi:hypothetical protein
MEPKFPWLPSCFVDSTCLQEISATSAGPSSINLTNLGWLDRQAHGLSLDLLLSRLGADEFSAIRCSLSSSTRSGVLMFCRC